MRHHGLILYGAALGLAAMGAVASPAVAAKAVKFQAPEGFKLQKDGTLVHQKSGTRFPLVYESFARTSNYAFDPDGKNIAVVYSYAVGRQTIEARIALVHILMMSAHEHYAAMAPIVGRYFQDLHFTKVQPLGDAALAMPGDDARGAWQGRFRAVRNRQPYMLSLTTVDLGYWSARVTAAYPLARADEAQDRIARLVAQIRATTPLKH